MFLKLFMNNGYIFKFFILFCIIVILIIEWIILFVIEFRYIRGDVFGCYVWWGNVKLVMLGVYVSFIGFSDGKYEDYRWFYDKCIVSVWIWI